jgi:hypothetical protein
LLISKMRNFKVGFIETSLNIIGEDLKVNRILISWI